MRRKHGWLIALLTVALLVAACGPQMTTPTPRAESDEVSAPPTGAPVGETAESGPSAPGELPVDADDWHVLGSPDAPVIVVEYSDFQ